MTIQMENISTSNLQQDVDLNLKKKNGSKINQHWRGKFVFNRTSIVLYRYAYSERQAWWKMCLAIAREQGVTHNMVMNYFNGEKDNFKIEPETIFEEASE